MITLVIGTRMFVYEWNSDYHINPLIIKQKLSCNTDGRLKNIINNFKIFKPYFEDHGIDKFRNPSIKDIETKFSKCLNETFSIIPVARRNRTKISLAATAGMRLFK